MSAPETPSSTPGFDLAGVLSRMTRKGARLVPVDEAWFDLVFAGDRVRPRRPRDEPSRRVLADHVQYAERQGWLVCDGDQGALRLTEAGALQARRGLDRDTPAAPPHVRVAAPTLTSAPTRPRGRVAGDQTPLQRLRQKRDGSGRPVLSSAHVEAGERLARDFQMGQMRPRVTANWDRAALGFAAERRAGNGAADVSDGAAAAQERVRRALRDLGPEFADLLIDLCCLEVGLEAIETQRRWPAHTARVVVGLGLDRLMRHYGIVGTGPSHSRGGRHWGDGDFKPTLSRWTVD